MTFELISFVLNLLLGGSLIVTLVTLRSIRHKAKEDVRAAELTNEEHAMKTFQTYIVEPLKKEIKGLRNEVQRFRKAIERIPDCDYADTCPVKRELQNNTGGSGEDGNGD